MREPKYIRLWPNARYRPSGTMYNPHEQYSNGDTLLEYESFDVVPPAYRVKATMLLAALPHEKSMRVLIKGLGEISKRTDANNKTAGYIIWLDKDYGHES